MEKADRVSVLCIVSMLAGALVWAVNVQAEAEFTVTATSDFVLEGANQMNESPALQPGIDFSDDSGFHA